MYIYEEFLYILYKINLIVSKIYESIQMERFVNMSRLVNEFNNNIYVKSMNDDD